MKLFSTVAAFAFQNAARQQYSRNPFTCRSLFTSFFNGVDVDEVEEASDSDEFHLFELESCLRMNGTFLSPRQRQMIGPTPPRLVCSKCGIREKAVQASPRDVANNSTTLFKIDESASSSYKLSDPTKLKESCGDIVQFSLGSSGKAEFQRSLLRKIPGIQSMIDKQWQHDPFTTIHLPALMAPSLEAMVRLVQDGQVILPSCIFKDVFVNELETFGVPFDKTSIHEEMEPAVLFVAVSAAQERIDAFRSDGVNKLAEDVNNAESELLAAKDVNSKNPRICYNQRLGS